MSHQIFASELFAELSDKQQELVAGGADFELAGSNYAKRLANLQGITTSGPNGSTGNSIGTVATVNTAAQDLLGLGGSTIPAVGALGGAPVLNGVASGGLPSPNGGATDGVGGASDDVGGVGTDGGLGH